LFYKIINGTFIAQGKEVHETFKEVNAESLLNMLSKMLCQKSNTNRIIAVLPTSKY